MSDTNVVDDEAWLYGESNPETEDKVFTDEKAEEIENIAIAFGENGDIEKPLEEVPSLPKDPDDTENSKGSDSDSDDDDEVQVTIGEIKDQTAFTYGNTPVNFNLKRGTVPTVAKPKGLDPEAVGTINGIGLYDFNLDSLEEKPWRKPGSDNTDYFNYGFTEDTWKLYCDKQKKLRTENNVQIKLVPTSPKDGLIPITAVNENSKYALPGQQGLLKKAGPPPGRKMSGSIDVIGGGAPSLPSRRPNSQRENVIQVMTTGRPFDVSAGLPPLHLPPPSHHHFQRSFMPDLSMPPPIMPPNVLPPSMMGPAAPYTDVYEGYPVSHPPPSMDDQVNYFNGSNPSFEDNFRQGSPRDRDSDSKRDRERRNYSSGYEAVEEYEHKRHREKDRDHHYDREERYDRERDRDRDRDRERDRERRHRDHREKEDRTRSRRRHHHDDEDHRSSRHKHKRSRREKEDSASSHPENSSSKATPTDHTPNADSSSKGAGEEVDQ